MSIRIFQDSTVFSDHSDDTAGSFHGHKKALALITGLWRTLKRHKVLRTEHLPARVPVTTHRHLCLVVVKVGSETTGNRL